MKKHCAKYLLIVLISALIGSCSTKKDAALNRGYHATTTKYNILYNGNLAFDKGYENLLANYYDNFWEILPIERMQVEADLLAADEPKDPDFQLAEKKATKAIQKHSMYIGGREKNPQMDEAYLLLAKSRYYDNRFIPALEAFNYILYKYPSSDKINEAKVWREKTNLRLMYDELAIQNLKDMFKEGKLKGQIKADAYATLAQAYLNLSFLDSAAVPLKEARNLTTNLEEKARYTFILGQLSEQLNRKKDAVTFFQEVIDMNRKSPRNYVIQAHANQFSNQVLTASDTVAFLDKYRKLLKDRENRPYLDLINRQVGLFYEKNDNTPKAISYLKESIKKSNGDEQLKARNYIDVGEIYFNTAKYEFAGHYYDSAMAILPAKSNDAYRIAKKRESLHDVILYEKTAKENDSILRLVAMSGVERDAYFQNYINELRKEDFRKLNKELRGASNSKADFYNMPDFGSAIMQSSGGSGTTGQGKTGFYFYSQNAVAYGKIDFKKRWGNRSLQDNWRWSSENQTVGNLEEVVENTQSSKGLQETVEDSRYSVAFYTSQIPTDEEELQAMKKDRDFAYYQLGTIYSEKFSEFELGAERLESLLLFDPEERLILPALYKLYKIYGSIQPERAVVVKNKIISEYPTSRYAALLQNRPIQGAFEDSSEQVYVKLYREFEQGEYLGVFQKVNQAIAQFSEDDYLSKFELLKANVIGRLEGVEAYKKALNYVALTYASKPEGKEAERITNQDIPMLESKKLSENASDNWKIIYVIEAGQLDSSGLLESKLKRYAIDRQHSGIKFSKDYYSKDKVFFVIHGLTSQANAEAVTSFLGLSKEYLVDQVPFYITSENYTVVQINKNWEEFLEMKKE